MGADLSLTVSVAPWCRACGTWLPKEGAATCSACDWPTDVSSVDSPSGIGTLHQIKKGLRTRSAVRVAQDDGQATLLYRGHKTVLVPEAELSEEDDWPWEEPRVTARSPFWQLIDIAVRSEDGRIKTKWSPEALRTLAIDGATSSRSELRKLGLDAFDNGRVEVIDALPLTESERAWLKCCHFAAQEDVEQALAQLLVLPVEKYPEKTWVVARFWPVVTGSENAAAIAEHVRPFIADVPLAHALLNGLSGEAQPDDSLGDVQGLLEAEGSEDVDRDTVNRLSALIADRGASTAECLPVGGRTRLLVAHRGLKDGHAQAVASSDLSGVPLAVMDDLIDGGLLDVSILDAGVLSPDDVHYMTARIAPERLPVASLEELEHQDELARRVFVDANYDRLKALPATDHQRHFVALSELSAGSTPEIDVAALLPEAQPLAKAIAAAAASGDIEALPETVLADATLWSLVGNLIDPRSYSPSESFKSQHQVLIEWLSLFQARELLFLGLWEQAIDAAKACLETAADERLRDEALNLMACGQYQLGKDEAAIGALEKALEDEYSESLQANIGIVAADLEPELAAKHLGRLVLEAPTNRLKVAAANRALAIWNADADPWAEEFAHEDSQRRLPEVLRDPLRTLATQDIALDDFRGLIRTLAVFDAEWLATADTLSVSPHHQALEYAFYRAMAEGLPQQIKALAMVTREAMDREWVVRERDDFVSAAIEVIAKDDAPVGLASMGIDVIESGVVVTDFQYVALSAVSIGTIAFAMDGNEGEPRDGLVDILIEADKRKANLSADEQTRLQPALTAAFNDTAVCIGVHRGRVIGEVIDAYNSIVNQLGRLRRDEVNIYAVKRNLDPLLEAARGTRAAINRILPYVEKDDLHSALTGIVNDTRGLETRIHELLG